MHPSVATACNKKQLITSIDDLKELVEEFQSKNLFEEILDCHRRIRFKDSEEVVSSKVRILKIMTIFCQIIPMSYE